MAKNVIELNGQKYDALTGKPVVATPKKPAAHLKQTGPRHLDGFSRRPGIAKSTTVSNTLHSKAQKSQTLMRTVVQKPAIPAKIHATTSAPAAAKATIHAQPRVTMTKPGRAIRANNINQNDLISKFGKTAPTIISAVIAVKAAPVAAHTVTQITSQVTPPKPALKKVVAPERKDPFHGAIENAISHAQPKARRPKTHHRIAKKLHVSPRFVSFIGVGLTTLSVAGVLAYQNMPEIAMRVAATRAGLNANLPGYQPAGFALSGPIKYDHGEVTVNYKSNSDERVFDVTQKNSSWNSETLLENYVTAKNQPYQTFQANGRTIYIYDGNKATWVDGGVWFNIDGKTNLNSDQLLRIANSL